MSNWKRRKRRDTDTYSNLTYDKLLYILHSYSVCVLFVCFVLDSLALNPKYLPESLVGQGLSETSAAGVHL